MRCASGTSDIATPHATRYSPFPRNIPNFWLVWGKEAGKRLRSGLLGEVGLGGGRSSTSAHFPAPALPSRVLTDVATMRLAGEVLPAYNFYILFAARRPKHGGRASRRGGNFPSMLLPSILRSMITINRSKNTLVSFLTTTSPLPKP